MTHASLSLVALPLTAAVLAVGLASQGPVGQAAGLCLVTAALLVGLRSHLGVLRCMRAQLAEARGEARRGVEAERHRRHRVEELLQVEQDSHRDAHRDARRHRVDALDASVRLRVGDQVMSASLVDLTFQELWLQLPPGAGRAWVPGLPARVTVRMASRSSVLGWAEAEGAPTPQGLLRLLWSPSLSEVALPRELWRAVCPRQALRVPGDGIEAALTTPWGPRGARVHNLSADGVALQMSLSRTEAGHLRGPLPLRLDLGDGLPIVIACHLRHVAVHGAVAHLGLAFDPAAASFAELHARVGALVLRRSTDRLHVREAS